MTQQNLASPFPSTSSLWIQKSVSLLDWITERQGQFFAWTILIAALQVCYELSMRYFFNSPSVWGLELTTYLCAVSYVMSGAYAECKNAHIRVDIFYNRWTTRTRAIFDLFLTDVLLLLVCGVLVWQGWLWFWKACCMGLTSGTIWDPPIWPMRLVLLLGTLFLLLSGVARALRDAYTLFTSEKLPS